MTNQVRNFDQELIVSQTIIPHSAYTLAYKRIDQAFRYATNAEAPTYLGVVGESGSGKSSLLKQFQDDHPATRDADGALYPIVRVSAPAKPSVKGFYSMILGATGDSANQSGTRWVLQERLVERLRNVGTKMLMVDEFQHFVYKRSDRGVQDTADMLKSLVDTTNVTLVAAGVGTFTGIFTDAQLHTRFHSLIHLPYFEWSTAAGQDEYVKLLHGFYVGLTSDFDLPKLHSENMSFRLFFATKGILRNLTNLLRQAVRNAIDLKSNVITIADLEKAYFETLVSKLGTPEPNPFDSAFLSITDLLVAPTRVAGKAPSVKPVEDIFSHLDQQPLGHLLSARR